jgi:MFS superfamily sulfate permease-like transporter
MPTTVAPKPAARSASAGRPLRFDRNELAGAFGDLGTDVPLIVGMVLAARLDPASVLVMYGLMQLLTGLVYRLPMPVQPLKAVAALVITQHIQPPVIFGAGLAIGLAMLFITGLGLIDWLNRVVPKSVVRGIQLGLGLQLASLALREYVGAEQVTGYWLAGLAFILVIALLDNRRLPAALPVIALGIAYAFAFKLNLTDVVASAGLTLPRVHVPTPGDVITGFVVLALPQLPLSLGNSILATRQVAEDLFPEVNLNIRKIGLTYAAMNLVSPFFSGVPVCHGSGGFAGHYAFGGRTGGSVVLYGAIFLVLGLFFAAGFAQVVQVFPLPMLGILLLFEGLALVVLVRDLAGSRADFFNAALVAVCAAFLPYGYVVGLLVGTLLAYLSRRGVAAARW